MKKNIRILALLLSVISVLFAFSSCGLGKNAVTDDDFFGVVYAIDEAGSYTERDEVALYIHVYGKLPSNFITKDEARRFGWRGGGLEEYAPGKCIGGDVFNNREGLLPEKSGRQYFECDIDTLGKDSRGAKRIVFSNDGLIFYTDDHYESFQLLYGKYEDGN